MNARTTTLLTVLALTLAACVAPMPAPPVKAPTVPEIEQPVLIPSTQTEQRQNLPAVQDSWAYPDYVQEMWEEHQQKVEDVEAARLLAAHKALTDKLMIGLPIQIRDDIAIYAAIKVAEMETAPSAAPASTSYPDILRGVLEGGMTTTPYFLPEQMTTNPKQPAVQELDDMLKPVTLPEDLTAAKIAMLEHSAIGAPPEIQAAIANYIEDLKLPASTMPARDQWYLEEQNYVLPEQMTTNPKQPAVQELDDMLKPVPVPATTPAMEPYWENFFNQMENAESLPASTMPVRDQWYLEDQTPTSLMERYQREKVAYALLKDLMTSTQTPGLATKEQTANALLRDLLADQPQQLVYETLFR
jgi:hypothetical protein